MGGANGYSNGIGISPKCEGVALCENFQDFEEFRKQKLTNSYIDGGFWKELLKDMEDRYRPAQFPGRHWAHGHLVWRFGRSGQVVGLDVLPGLPYSSFGIRIDP